MTTRIRDVAGVGVAVALLVVSLVLSLPGAEALAQPNAPKAEEVVLYPDGVVDTHRLPPPGLEARAGGQIHRHFPDLNLLLQHKEEMRTRRGGLAPSVPPPTVVSPSTTALTTATTTQSFMGLRQSESGGYYPPDTQVAAGPSHIVEAVNLEVRVWNRSNLLQPPTTYTLCSLFGVSCTFLSDPKVRFDPISLRWFIVAITYQSTGSWLIAVSLDPTPTTFVRYKVSSVKRTFPDFPGLGMSQDKVVLTGNAFSGSFRGAEFVVLNKAQLVARTTVYGSFFGPFSNAFTIQPAFALPSLDGTTVSTVYMADVAYNSASSVRIWSVTGVPGVSTVSYTTTSLPIPTLASPPDARQPGTTALINTNDNSLLDAVYRNGFLWVSANSACTPSGDTVRACLRYMQISISTNGISLLQSPDVGDVGKYYYYPAIQIDTNNNLVTVFSGSSASTYASVYASGHLASAGLGTFQPLTLIKAGETSYTPNRWGDYSGAGIDPSDQTKVWVAGEYALNNGTGKSEWGTWIAEFGF